MTKYYKQTKSSGDIVRLLTYDFCPNITNPLIIEITEEEYDALFAEIKAANQPKESDPDEIAE